MRNTAVRQLSRYLRGLRFDACGLMRKPRATGVNRSVEDTVSVELMNRAEQCSATHLLDTLTEVIRDISSVVRRMPRHITQSLGRPALPPLHLPPFRHSGRTNVSVNSFRLATAPIWTKTQTAIQTKFAPK